MENRRLTQQLANSQPSSNSSSPSQTPHFAPNSSVSFYSKNNRSASQYSFLPALYSPSPPLSLTNLSMVSQSPSSHLSPTTFSPIGSPTRHSPTLQTYQQNQHQLQQQLQQQFVCFLIFFLPLPLLSSPSSLLSSSLLASSPFPFPILLSHCTQFNEEPSSIDDLKRQLSRLELLLSETTMQNSHLKAENSQLFAACEQTKNEYSRLLHKLDVMEVFLRQGKEKEKEKEKKKYGKEQKINRANFRLQVICHFHGHESFPNFLK